MKSIDRQVQLLQKLLPGQRYKMCELTKLFGVTRRTIFRDMKTLRKAGVPLEFNVKSQRYLIPSGTFGTPNDLTAEEVLSIWAVATSVGQHSHIPFHDSLSTAVNKLKRNLPGSTRRKLARVTKSIAFVPLKVPRLALKFSIYQTIIDAIDRRLALEIVYASPSKMEPISTRVRPYKFVFSEHSWYLVGRSSLHSEVRIFNLQRIESVQLTKERFSVPKNFDWERRIGNAWTVLPESGHDSLVVVKFSPQVAPNIAQVKWHKTQSTRFNPDGSLIFKASVSGLDEVSWWILRYGAEAEVLFPARLRRIIARKVVKMRKLYADTIQKLGEAI
jgi:predicted DNA-binding transcriptional regulator YafY